MSLHLSLKNFSGLFTGLLSIGTFSTCERTAEADHPNILMIIVDDLNDWVGVMNAHPNAYTPNIDGLAERGTLFTNAHTTAPLCGPSRAALMSGLYPSTTGVYGHLRYPALRQNQILSQTIMLPEYLSENGYITLSTGKIYHEGSPEEAFDVVGLEKTDFGPRPSERLAYTPPPGLNTSTDWGAFPEKDEDMPDWKSAQWAMQQLGKNYEKPFFLSVGFVRPHVPLFVPQKWFDLHPLEDVKLPLNMDGQLDRLPETVRQFADLPQMPKMEWMKEEMRWEKFTQAYLASCSFADHCVGMVLDALANSPHAGNTIVVFFSDHGYHVGTKGIWAKHTLWEESTRTPMIIVLPDGKKNQRTHKPVSLIDIYPTLTELAGLPAYNKNEGKSLVPLLNDPDAKGYDCAITTHGFGNHSVRDIRWRYTRYEDGTEELYDHWNDPDEWYNLAESSQHNSVIVELRDYLPQKNASSDPGAKSGMDYNQYLLNLFERTKASK